MRTKLATLIFSIALLSIGTVSSGDFALTILHTNDVHARFLSFNESDQPCYARDFELNTCYGGAARRQTAFKQLSSKDENVVKFDTGGQYHGTIWYSALKWEPIARAMHLFNYDAITLGNHEFDDGVDGLVPFLQNISTPVVCSNIVDKGNVLKSLIHPYLIKTVGGEKIGIVGCITVDTSVVSSPGPLLQFEDEVDAVRHVVDNLLAQGINKIIVLSHAGVEVDEDICTQVKGVDVVIGGRTHTFLYNGDPPSSERPEGPYPIQYANEGSKHCLVVHGYAFGKYLGRLNVNFDDAGHVTSWSGNPILLDAKTYPEDPEMVALLQPYHTRLEHFEKIVVTTNAVGLDGQRKSCRVRECNLGNIVTDAAVYLFVKRALGHNETGLNGTQHWSSAAVAVWPSGGIRNFETKSGATLTLNDLYTILPFGNIITKITVTGATLREALEHAVRNYNPNNPAGRFLQVSGLRVFYDMNRSNGRRVQDVHVRCSDCAVPKYEPLDAEKTYAVITISYLANGGDGFTMLKDKRSGIEMANLFEIDILMDYLKTYKPSLTGEELRIEIAEARDRNDRRRINWRLRYGLG